MKTKTNYSDKPVIISAYRAKRFVKSTRDQVYDAVKKLQPCVTFQIMSAVDCGKTSVEEAMRFFCNLPSDHKYKVHYVYAKVRYDRNTVPSRVYAIDKNRLPKAA